METDVALRDALHSDDALALMANVGYTKPLTRLSQSDRKEIIDAVQTFHLFIKVKAVMDQFQEGLRYARVHIYLKQFMDIIRLLLLQVWLVTIFLGDIKNLLTAEYS